jgi:hypothetical protein
VTWNSITMYSENDIVPRFSPTLAALMTSAFGEIDKLWTDRRVTVAIRLWGAWESLSTIFPSGLLNPVAGTSLYGGSDLPLVATARNGDQLTIVNAQITKLIDLYLGVDSSLFAADVEFTGILAGGANPEDASSYFSTATSQTYTEAFAKTNFKRVRFSGAWGAKSGYTAIIPQKGVNISWALNLSPLRVDGLGTIDMTIKDMVASAKCIPIGPTVAQLKAQSQFETALGTLQSANAADLIWTGSGGAPVVTLKNAAMGEWAEAFGVEPLRNGEVAWNTTRGFSTGSPVAVATVA